MEDREIYGKRTQRQLDGRIRGSERKGLTRRREYSLIPRNISDKKSDDRSMKLEGHIFVHGNRDADRDQVRADCAAAEMEVIRIILSIGTSVGFYFGYEDIKGVYMKSGPIKRNVYGRPPRECNRKRGIIWRLPKSPYILGDDGRQWSVKIDDWMHSEWRKCSE